MPKVNVNGQVINFPDSMSQDQIKAVLREKFPAPVQQQQAAPPVAQTATPEQIQAAENVPLVNQQGQPVTPEQPSLLKEFGRSAAQFGKGVGTGFEKGVLGVQQLQGRIGIPGSAERTRKFTDEFGLPPIPTPEEAFARAQALPKSEGIPGAVGEFIGQTIPGAILGGPAGPVAGATLAGATFEPTETAGGQAAQAALGLFLSGGLKLAGKAFGRIRDAKQAQKSLDEILGKGESTGAVEMLRKNLPKAPTENIDNVVDNSLRAFEKGVLEKSDGFYREFTKASVGKKVPINKYKESLLKLSDDLDNLSKEGLDEGLAGVKRLVRKQSALADTREVLSPSALKELRSEILKKARDAEKKDITVKLNKLAQGLEEDLGSFAATEGGDIAAKYRKAQDFFNKEVLPLRDRKTLVGKILGDQTKIDRVFKTAFSPDNPQQSANIFKLLDPSAKSAVKGQKFNQAVFNSLDDAGEISITKLRKNLIKLGRTKDVIFNKQELGAIKAFEDTAAEAVKLAEKIAKGDKQAQAKMIKRALIGAAALTAGGGAISEPARKAKELIF